MNMFMSIVSVVLGLIFFYAGMLGLISLGEDTPALSVEEPVALPKTNDHRVVRMSDGTYRIETYWGHPGWTEVMYGEYETEAKARDMLTAIDRKHDRPTVEEVLP